jgi:hypothetical protein
VGTFIGGVAKDCTFVCVGGVSRRALPAVE